MVQGNQTYEKFTKELRCLELFVCKQFLKMVQINKTNMYTPRLYLPKSLFTING